jgi:hypothetical protein
MTRVVSVARSKGSIALGAIGAALISLGLLGVTGCPGTLDPSLAGGTGAGGSTGTCDIQPLLVTKYTCTLQGSCHDATAAVAGGLDLVSPGLEKRLVGVGPKGGNSSLCGGMSQTYLTAGSNPATGLFLSKLKPAPPCGMQMPTLGMKVSTDDFNCFQKWANNAVMMAGATGAGGMAGTDAGGTGGTTASDAGGQ